MTTYLELARTASIHAFNDGEWAGAPIPIDNHEMIVAPTYKYQGLHGFKFGDDKPEPEGPPPNIRLINEWFCCHRGGTVMIIEEDGKRSHLVTRDYFISPYKNFWRQVGSMDVAVVQDPEAELTALDKLKTMIAPHLWSAYILHGIFLETSKRSGVTYVFRKGRPTVALRPKNGSMKILCGLCLHPVAYYADTFCGVMVPTDEVISHLVMMRTDEHFYWRKANQHPPYLWQSGL